MTERLFRYNNTLGEEIFAKDIYYSNIHNFTRGLTRKKEGF